MQKFQPAIFDFSTGKIYHGEYPSHFHALEAVQRELGLAESRVPDPQVISYDDYNMIIYGGGRFIMGYVRVGDVEKFLSRNEVEALIRGIDSELKTPTPARF